MWHVWGGKRRAGGVSGGGACLQEKSKCMWEFIYEMNLGELRWESLLSLLVSYSANQSVSHAVSQSVGQSSSQSVSQS